MLHSKPIIPSSSLDLVILTSLNNTDTIFIKNLRSLKLYKVGVLVLFEGDGRREAAVGREGVVVGFSRVSA